VLLPTRKLLNRALDPDGDPFQLSSAVANSTHGGAVLISGPNVLYVPPANFAGNDSFSYTIEDNRGGTATANVEVFVYSGTLPSMNQVMILPVPGGQRVRFAGVPGKNYLIQRATSLAPPLIWTTLQTLTAPSYGVMEFDDLTNLQSAFYRTLAAP